MLVKPVALWDAWLNAAGVKRARLSPHRKLLGTWVNTAQGTIRVLDSGGDRPCLLLSPDGPNVIEHYQALIAMLSPHYRVVCFDMPGFGFSAPSGSYDHSLERGARAILELMDRLGIAKAILALSCANGFYAIRVAQMAARRVERLVLSQTPSLVAMHGWAQRVVPRVLGVPLLGQLLGRIFRQKMANAWYRIALPKATNPEPFMGTSRHALRCGGCFSLAGVVQGLLREPTHASRLQGVACTVLWGTQDRSHRLTRPDALLQDIPHAQLVVLDDCGHFPDLENPQRFFQALMQYPTQDVPTRREECLKKS